VAILKRRDRSVIFRLSQDEYQQLRDACTKRGAASISSFARSELLRSIDPDGLPGVAQQLSNLQSLMQRMAQMLETISTRPKGSK
jgi:hypothetical protein